MPPLYERHVKSNYQQHNRKVMYFRTHFPHTNKKLHTFTYPLRQTAKGVSLPASRQKGSLFRGLSGFHDGGGVPGRTTLFIFYDKYPFYDLVFPYLCTES